MESTGFEKFSITLPAEMAKVIHARVSSGDYGSVSEVIREAMRTWLQRERRLAALDTAIARGLHELEAGQGEDGRTVRQALIEELRAKDPSPT